MESGCSRNHIFTELLLLGCLVSFTPFLQRACPQETQSIWIPVSGSAQDPSLKHALQNPSQHSGPCSHYQYIRVDTWDETYLTSPLGITLTQGNISEEEPCWPSDLGAGPCRDKGESTAWRVNSLWCLCYDAGFRYSLETCPSMFLLP